MARGVKVAAASYWPAYKITFLSRERVRVSGADVSRIALYDRLALEEGDRLLMLQETPCAGSPPIVPGWYLCRQGW